MKVVWNNTHTSDGLREKVLQTMKKQVLKKFYGSSERATIKHSCDAPFIKRNNIEQIQNQTV